MQDIKSKKSKQLHIKYVKFFIYQLYLNKAIKIFFKQTHCCEGMMIKLMSMNILRERQVYSLMLHLKSSFLENHT